MLRRSYISENCDRFALTRPTRAGHIPPKLRRVVTVPVVEQSRLRILRGLLCFPAVNHGHNMMVMHDQGDISCRLTIHIHHVFRRPPIE